MAVHPLYADARMDEHKVFLPETGLGRHLENVFVVPEKPPDDVITVVITAAVAYVPAVEVLAVVVPEKECDPPGVVLCEGEDFPEIVKGTLRRDVVEYFVNVVGVQVVS